MQTNTIILAVALLAIPLAVAALPDSPAPEPVPGSVIVMAQQTDLSVTGRPLSPAPVPGNAPGVSPAERAGSTLSSATAAGPVDATPFSGAPDAEHDTGSPAERADPAGSSTPLPNLGR